MILLLLYQGQSCMDRRIICGSRQPSACLDSPICESVHTLSTSVGGLAPVSENGVLRQPD